MTLFQHRANKILQRLNELAECSDDNSCISRMFGTNAFLKGQSLIKSWMEVAGLETRIDSIGNVRGKLKSTTPNAKTFVLASHFDSVVNAGKFDGPFGVVTSIDIIETLIGTGTSLPFDIEVIAFSDEEGVRFHSTFLGSRVIAGSFSEELLVKKDANGLTLSSVLVGMNCDLNQIKDDCISPEEWLGYFEMHIEQGPVLYESNEPVAVVTGIAGQRRMIINLKGMAGHAGTVPMNMRQDALCCASEMILGIEKFGLEHNDELVATVGKLDVINAASNVIPGEVVFSLDLRSADQNIIDQSFNDLKIILGNIAMARKIRFILETVQETAPVICDAQLTETLATAITSTGHKITRLVSGAGHDAVPISAVAPVAMLFVRCYKGISHNPLEDVEIKDIAAAVQVGENFILQLAQKYK